MPLTLRCPACNKPLKVGDALLGKRVKCPKCAHVFVGKLATKPAPAVRPTAPPTRKPAPKTTLRAPISQGDPLDPSEDVPLGATQADGQLKKPPQTKKTPPSRQDPNVTAEHTPPPSSPEFTQEFTAEGNSDPDTTADSVVSRPSRTKGTRVLSDDELDAPAAQIPENLGGYQVIKELGRGGMGRVLLARQKSLDRQVALKVMNPDRARDANFLARFMREAFAAAQLTHHHVVQIYDIGHDGSLHFFSMEFVKGESLMNLVQRDGKLDPEVAVGYILQAARGLKFGHDLGMIHRDVKPDNLMLNDQGIVKVADLGLVKLANMEEIQSDPTDEDEPQIRKGLSKVTRLGQAMGTPTYMAPEQARDAMNVDGRCDIYSLGCTLYVLLTGKPPYEGKTAVEVLSKHATAPLVPPDVIVKRVPKELSAILTKMMAKKPANRYATMDEVIKALEKYLGIQQAGPFTPKEEHATLLEQCVNKFNNVPRVKLRRNIMLAFGVGCAALFVTCLLFKWLWLAAGLLGLPLMTPAAYFLIQGYKERTFLFRKAREWIVDMDWMEWLYLAGTACLLFALLYLFNLLLLWSIMAFLSLACALAFYVLVDRQLAAERKPYVDKVEKLLRSLRLQGLEERSLRNFVCKYSGKNWEEMYEVLFGYDGKLQAREWLRGEAAHGLNQHAAWREPLIRWFDAYRASRKEKKERKLLQALEAKALEAQGVGKGEAKEKAAQVAQVMVAQAAEIHKQATRPIDVSGEPAPQVSVKMLLQTAQNPDAAPPPPKKPLGERVKDFAGSLAGARFRFLAGVVLILICALWLYSNDFLEGDNLSQAISTISERGNWEALDTLGKPLPLLPEFIGAFFQNFNIGLAGLILVISAFLGGKKPGLVAWPLAILVVMGPRLPLPIIGPMSPGMTTAVIAVGLGIVTLVLRRLLHKKQPAWSTNETKAHEVITEEVVE